MRLSIHPRNCECPLFFLCCLYRFLCPATLLLWSHLVTLLRLFVCFFAILCLTFREANLHYSNCVPFSFCFSFTHISIQPVETNELIIFRSISSRPTTVCPRTAACTTTAKASSYAPRHRRIQVHIPALIALPPWNHHHPTRWSVIRPALLG
jgi:hypothetical protein